QGRFDAFPYSALMLALLSIPQAVANYFFADLVHVSEAFRLFLIRIPMLVADFTIFAVLCNWFETKRQQVVWLYWCSPILFFISYVHGQLDSIPTAFLFLSLFFLFQKKTFQSGVVLGLGLATKLHLLLAIPFLLIYQFRNPIKERSRIFKAAAFLGGMLIAASPFIVPFLFSDGYRQIVFGTQETRRFFEFTLSVSDGLKLYIAPAGAVFLLLRFTSTPKINRDLAVLFLALLYITLVLLVPPAPGWYFWSIPLVCYFYIRQESITSFSYWLVNALYLGYYVFFPAISVQGVLRESLATRVVFLGKANLESLAFTVLQSAVALIVFWVYRIGVQSNREYRTRNSPLLIGIGGDSGTGKHTLSRTLRALVGSNNSVETYGDDYHRWARGDEAWKQLTHLDPKANHMFQPIEHIQALKAWKSVRKPVYDHQTGKFTDSKILMPKPFTFFVGLHPFYIRRMRNLIDIKIYVEPDESLRQFWKVQRDGKSRGYTREQVVAQIESRSNDAARYVHPQRQFADWIVSFSPLKSLDLLALLKEEWADPELWCRHILKNDLALESLCEQLQQVPGLKVQWHLHPDMERQVLDIRGHPSEEAVKTIAYRLFPNIHELLESDELSWSRGSDGISQLIFVTLLDDRVRNLR
ncbi:MAG: hypothetical protein AAB116_21140, partial [Candidatus Poribacteria bacterium]